MGDCLDPFDDISEIEGYQSALSKATPNDVCMKDEYPLR